ncbi:hypothetical protein Tco_1366603 [Tanacetum coccineum]
MEAAVQQYHVDKQCFEIQKKQFLIENDRLLDQIIFQYIVNIVGISSLDTNTSVNVNSSVAMNDSVNYIEMCNKCLDLEAELQAKVKKIEKLKANIKCLNNTFTINNVKKDIEDIETINIELEHRVTKLITETEHLKPNYKQLYDSIKPSRVWAKEHVESLVNQLNQKKVKGKDIVDNAAQVSNATTIAPGMYKLNPVILAPMVKNNREAHEYYLKHTMEQAAILRELLCYVRDTCPNIHKPSKKLVAITPINKKKTLRLADTVTSSGNIPKETNRPILSSTGVNPSTSASKSKPSGAKAFCSVCNECLFDANHAMCLIDHVNSMNVLAKSISKKNKKRKEWKPTGKVFNSIGYKWKPTKRTFTLVGNVCPLTSRPKVPKSVQNSKPKVAKSMTSNKIEPGTSRGSDTSVAPSSSSLIDCKLSKLFCGIWTPDAPST